MCTVCLVIHGHRDAESSAPNNLSVHGPLNVQALFEQGKLTVAVMNRTYIPTYSKINTQPLGLFYSKEIPSLYDVFANSSALIFVFQTKKEL